MYLTRCDAYLHLCATHYVKHGSFRRIDLLFALIYECY